MIKTLTLSNLKEFFIRWHHEYKVRIEWWLESEKLSNQFDLKGLKSPVLSN